MWLSTRENRGIADDDNWTELTQHESLYATFVDYELKTFNKETWCWSGDLPGPALTILHQHAVQGWRNRNISWLLHNFKTVNWNFPGDLTELQTALARFVAASRVYLKTPLDPRWMLQLLTDVEDSWNNFTLTREEEMWLAEKYTAMQGKCSKSVRAD